MWHFCVSRNFIWHNLRSSSHLISAHFLQHYVRFCHFAAGVRIATKISSKLQFLNANEGTKIFRSLSLQFQNWIFVNLVNQSCLVIEYSTPWPSRQIRNKEPSTFAYQWLKQYRNLKYATEKGGFFHNCILCLISWLLGNFWMLRY